ncbi:hypothetical protein C8J57DRAFT_490514 [Mycena rebaudengoi]|nr:hypothetical protein C8J57DRAFT_490514 [Mycena rebaudengoi]
MFSSTSLPVDQETTDSLTNLKHITDATEDGYPCPEDQSVWNSSLLNRSSSFQIFDDRQFGMDDPFRPSLSFSHSNPDRTNSLWSAVSAAKQDRETPKVKPLVASLSLASTFTSMTGDELSDEIEPWEMTTSSRFDFGFSSALRDTCTYQVPHQFLPSEDDIEIDETASEVSDTDEEDSEEDSDSETVYADEPESASTPVARAEEEDDDMGSDIFTVCGDELDCTPPQVTREPSVSITDPVSGQSTNAGSSWVYDWLPPTPPRLLTDQPRRSVRITCAQTRAHSEPLKKEPPQTPSKRRTSAPKDTRPAKRLAVEGKSGIPTIRVPARVSSPSSPCKDSSPTKKLPRVVLRV